MARILRSLLQFASIILASSGVLQAENAPTVATFDAKQHDADPAKQGWIGGTDREYRATVRMTKVGEQPVLRLEDDDADGAEGFYYRRELSPEHQETARKFGFVYRWRVRIPENTAPTTRAISTEVCIAKTDGSERLRFGVQIGRNGNELAGRVYAGTSGVVEGIRRVKNAADFHDWTLIFDAETNVINLLVDGSLILATRFDHLDSGHNLVFGSRATGTGISEWAHVSFQAGLSEGDSVSPPPEPPHRVDIFTGGDDGYFAYRIPALLATPKGMLLAFCEGRKTSLDDLGNNDLVLKRSDDGGKTWGPMEIIYDEGDKVTIGNPTPVIDEETNTIWLTFSRDARDILMMKSSDDGKTWSKAVDMTDQVKKPDWKFYTVGPGNGIQLKHGPKKGRLIIPAYHRTTQDKSGPTIAQVFYSDDHGESWQIGDDVGPHACECQVVETIGSDGPELLLNARNHWARSGGRPELAGRRIIARSHDAGQTWDEPTFDEVLIEPTCQASLFRYSWPKPEHPGRILFTNPASRGRGRMTVRVSDDEGHSWSASRVVDGGSAAYSTLAVMPNGKIGLLYEAGGYKRLVFTSFDLNWISAGTDEK